MHVTLLTPDDHAAVTSIANESAVELDVAVEAGRKWASVWVARLTPEDAPIAFLVGWWVADELHVQDVATRAAFRRQGAATALVSAAVDEAADRKVRRIWLEVRASNGAAIGLYRRFGFRAMGVRRGYYANDREDAIEMSLPLDPETGSVRRGPDEVALPRP